MAATEEKSIVSTHEQVPQISRPGGLPSRFATAPAAGGMTGKDLLRAIRRRIWMIVIIVFISAIMVSAGTYIWADKAPLYASEAVLVINPPKSEVKIGFADTTARDIMDRLCKQNVRVVKDVEVMRKVLEAPEVKATEWFKKGRDIDDNLKRLIEDVSVSEIPSEGAIRISMTGTKAMEVTQIVNAVATVAVDNSRRFTADRYTESLNENRRKLDGLTKEKDTLLKKRQALRPADIPMFEQKVNDLSQTLSASRTAIQKKLEEVRDSELSLKGFVSSPDPGNASVVQYNVSQDAAYRALQMQQAAAQTDRDSAVNKYGPRHRKVLELENRLASLAKQTEDARQLATNRGIIFVKESYEGELNKRKEQLLGLRQDFDETTANMKGLQETLDTIKDLDVQIGRINEQINVASTRVEDISMLSKQDNPLSIRVPASPPLEYSWPKPGLFIVLSVVLGLLISLALTFLLEFMDSSVRNPGDITRRVDLPVLGLVPHGDDLEEEIGDLRLAFNSHPNSLVGEAFRQIRTSLLFSGPALNRRSLLITSPQPEDGRTTVALNLAAAIARGGRKVLVVDANFRQPAIRKIFPQCREAGLSNILVGQGAWRDLICQVEPNLCVLPSGPLPPNPAELLDSEPMRQLVAELTSQFDQVIFDGAPLLVVSDSRNLATVVDGVVIVVRAGANTHGVVKRANDMLTQIRARVIGMTLNGVRATRGGYLRKSYETFYDYHHQILPGGPPPQA